MSSIESSLVRRAFVSNYAISGNPEPNWRKSGQGDGEGDTARWGKVFDRIPVQLRPPTEIPAGPSLCRMSAFTGPKNEDIMYVQLYIPVPFQQYTVWNKHCSCAWFFLNRAIKSYVKTHLFLSLSYLHCSLSCCLPSLTDLWTTHSGGVKKTIGFTEVQLTTECRKLYRVRVIGPAPRFC